MELRFTQRHVTALNFLLIAALAYFAALCVNDIVSRTITKAAPEGSASIATRITTGPRTRAQYDAIVKRDIFNLTPQDSAPAPVVVEDLHLKLLGTSHLSKSKPYAIIEDQNGNQSLYQVGEDIPDAGRLVSVETNRAIIDRGRGRRVAIDIPSTQIPAAEPSRLGVAVSHPPHGMRGGIRQAPPLPSQVQRHHPNSQDDDSEDNADDEKDDDESKLDLKHLGPGKFEASRSEVVQSMNNPAQFYSQVHAQPHLNNGKMDGFSVSEIAPSSVFQQLGLQNGDTITSINGQSVTSAMQAMGVMNAVQTRPSIDVTLNRNGSPVQLHLDLR